MLPYSGEPEPGICLIFKVSRFPWFVLGDSEKTGECGVESHALQTRKLPACLITEYRNGCCMVRVDYG